MRWVVVEPARCRVSTVGRSHLRDDRSVACQVDERRVVDLAEVSFRQVVLARQRGKLLVAHTRERVGQRTWMTQVCEQRLAGAAGSRDVVE
ncbi:MAG: hypothetical protein RLZZ450_7443 [Pseudomonadota bacterium]